MTLLIVRGIRAVGVVTGECSSAALWPFAACKKRIVTKHSIALFHPMRWQSEERVGIFEASEWARHFGELETSMDQVLADLFGVNADLIRAWGRPGRYVSGDELVAAGIAELSPLTPLSLFKSAKRDTRARPSKNER